MSNLAAARQTPDSVLAELNYLLDTGERPVHYNYPPPPGVPQYSSVFLPTQVRIHNARLLEQAPTVEDNGFELLHEPSALLDFRDDQAIRQRYYRETEELVKRATGAVKVVVFDHTLRFGDDGAEDRGLRVPVRFVHSDQTTVSGPRCVHDHLPAAEAEERLGKRYAIFNLWRPIDRPAISAPLALCDARSIEPDDLIATDLLYPERTGEIYLLKPNPRHRWFYFPNLTPEEALLLKIYDSSSADVTRLSAHTAFDDPNTPADAPTRHSIEVRTLAFFDE